MYQTLSCLNPLCRFVHPARGRRAWRGVKRSYEDNSGEYFNSSEEDESCEETDCLQIKHQLEVEKSHSSAINTMWINAKQTIEIIEKEIKQLKGEKALKSHEFLSENFYSYRNTCIDTDSDTETVTKLEKSKTLYDTLESKKENNQRLKMKQSELDLVNVEKQELEAKIANQSKEIGELKQNVADRQTNHIEIMAEANQTIDGLEKRNEKFEKEIDLLTQNNSLKIHESESIIEKQSESLESMK